MALSDPGEVIATPLTIIERTETSNDIEEIIIIINQNQVGQIIVGLPRTMSGSIGKQAEKVRHFTRLLDDHTQIPIEFRDERLTTIQAKRSLQEGNIKGKKGVNRNDDIAAALILQSYLDEKREGNSANS